MGRKINHTSVGLLSQSLLNPTENVFTNIHQMYSDDQLGGLGTPAGMVGSPKSSLKFLFVRPTLRSGRLSENAWDPEGLPEIFLRAQP